MNSYLAVIAARNNIAQNQAFMPALPPPPVAEPDADAMDVVEDWSENKQSKSAELPESHGTHHDTPLQVQKNNIRPETGPIVQESERKVQYISNHVERMRYEDKITEQYSSAPSQTHSSIETPFDNQHTTLPPKVPLRERDVPDNLREKVEILTRITPQDGTTTSHSPGNEQEDITVNRPSPIVSVLSPAPLKSSQGKHTVQEIMPRIPESFSQDKQRSAAESKNETVPKLTIGKITVEIVPPPASQPQKVITRIVQKPADDNNGRMNRLGIGLGQL